MQCQVTNLTPRNCPYLCTYMSNRRDPFGHKLWIKRALIRTIGRLTWKRYVKKNSIAIEGTEYLANLPDRNVLFVSNHQTYFADVIAFLHVFCAVRNGQENSPVFCPRPARKQHATDSANLPSKPSRSKRKSPPGPNPREAQCCRRFPRQKRQCS